MKALGAHLPVLGIPPGTSQRPILVGIKKLGYWEVAGLAGRQPPGCAQILSCMSPRFTESYRIKTESVSEGNRINRMSRVSEGSGEPAAVVGDLPEGGDFAIVDFTQQRRDR